MAITREQILDALGGRGRPALSARAILTKVGGHRGQAKSLRALLRTLALEGQLERVDRRYRAARQDGLVEGVVVGAGEGARVRNDAGAEWSIESAGAHAPGDRVLLWPQGAQPAKGTKAGGTRRGEILQVLSGRREGWIGVFGRDRGGTVVTPYRDDTRWCIRIGARDGGRARFGEVVVVAPLGAGPDAAAQSGARARRPKARRSGGAGRRRGRERNEVNAPRGRVVERLGRPGGAEADFRAVAWKHRLAVDFPAEVIAEAEAQASTIDASEIERRLDLRDRCFVTIDPPTARDHDDAVCVESVESVKGAESVKSAKPVDGRAGGGDLRLWVAIADVAHFVKPGSALDREALQRGNSCYFPDRAIPMLPERLSGQLCSLRPGTDRLAVVVELIVDSDGACRRPSFHQAVVQSRACLSYAEAAQGMVGQRPPREAGTWEDGVAEQLVRFAEVARRLGEHRARQGSLDFDLPAADVLQDEYGRPIDIVRAERTIAHRAVEDAMLVANRAVASGLSGRSLSTVFRVHEPPSDERLGELNELFQSFGLSDGGRESLDRPAIARALQRASGRAEESLVNQAALRTMRQARYDPENLGHYALGFENYLHFTSPIRRYADLVVHRAVKEHLAARGQTDPKPEDRQGQRPASAKDWLRAVSVRTSFRERVAMQAEREILDLKRCALMSSRVGEEFAATVTGVAQHGLYVTLDQPFVSGLIHVSQLGHSVDYDARTQALVAQRSGRRFELGDRLRVELISVDQLKGWISFSVSGQMASAGRGRRRAR